MEGGRSVRLRPEEDCLVAQSVLWGLRATIVAPVGQDQRQVREVYLIVVIQVSQASGAGPKLVEHEQDVRETHDQVAVGIAYAVALIWNSIEVKIG